MVELEESILRVIAGKFGLSIQFVYKEYKLMELLGEWIIVSANSKLPIIMKGGTALNKIYFGELQRFSEDVDFDYSGDVKNLVAFMKKIEKFSVQGPWSFRSVVRFHCMYKFRNQADHIRLEFNIGSKTNTYEPISLRPITSALVGISHLGIYSYAFDDLVARKLDALKNRCEGKDIWDSYYALPKTKNIRKAVSKMLKKDKANVDDFFKQIIKELERTDVKELMRNTNQYIPVYLRPKSWTDIVSTLISRIEMSYLK